MRGVSSNGYSQFWKSPQKSNLTKTQDADSFNQKQGLSKAQKRTITIGSILTGVVAFGLFAYKRNLKVLKKLYDENIVLQNLPEKIDFKEAKTVEEAVKFTKDVLKVKDVDEGFTLDALNFVNKGLTEVSNANKGKVFMPRKIWFDEMAAKEENCIAYINQDIKSP